MILLETVSWQGQNKKKERIENETQIGRVW